jgi:pyruvate/2-oxoglutarate dehydrogenase complex dihydrolipoamide dehydrogenase (E3) component
MPSKNIIHSANVVSYFRGSKEFGIRGDGDVSVDMSVLRDRKRRMVAGLNEMYLDIYKKTGAELIRASGRFVGPRPLDATLPDGTTRRSRGRNVVIGTGTHAVLIAGLPYTALREAILTHPTFAEGLNALFSSTPSMPKSMSANDRSAAATRSVA